MGYTGLVPAEYSSGEKTRRGHITKAGSEPVRTALTEAAWAYRFAPATGATPRRRQDGACPDAIARSWKAQRRLSARYKHLPGTLAAAGTIPARSVNAPATPVRSEGHHPAGTRPAIPTRVYESGSDGGSRHAAPVRHPHPPRPRPQGQAGTRPMP